METTLKVSSFAVVGALRPNLLPPEDISVRISSGNSFARMSERHHGHIESGRPKTDD